MLNKNCLLSQGFGQSFSEDFVGGKKIQASTTD